MRGQEELYGYGVGIVLLVSAVANLVVTHGKGAPAHPQTALAVVGVLAALVMALTVRLRNRLVTPFAAVIAAFFVTLPKVPNSLSFAHIVTLVVPVAYALIVTQRHRKAQGPRMARGRRPAGAGRGAAGGGGARAVGGRGVSTGSGGSSRPSGRYTPPKAKPRRR